MAEDLRHFTTRVLEHWGAAVETKGETVEALLPGDLATRLRMKELVRLRFTPQLEEYYLGIAGEIRTRLQKKSLSGAEAEKEEIKAAAAERELQSKIHDLEEKYAVRVQVSFVSVLYVTVPVLQATMSYQRRQAFRELPCFWNPILKDWEALACEENTFAFSLCDDKQHVTCADCSRPCPTVSVGSVPHVSRRGVLGAARPVWGQSPPSPGLVSEKSRRSL